MTLGASRLSEEGGCLQTPIWCLRGGVPVHMGCSRSDLALAPRVILFYEEHVLLRVSEED